ncbi:hypothetical protein [Corticicoccus populi]|uniref:Uncharacterized protein n=1 Tax=Corticicoccus populi TaxID=1812821 RepID=A0ABW5WX36_9STAP
MKVMIRRDSRFPSPQKKMNIQIDNKKISEIENHQVLEMSSVKEKAAVSASHFASNSNKISVSDGDEVKLTSRKINKLIYFLSIFMLIVTPVLFGVSQLNQALLYDVVPFNTYISAVAVFLITLSLSGIHMYRLDIVTSGRNVS